MRSLYLSVISLKSFTSDMIQRVCALPHTPFGFLMPVEEEKSVAEDKRDPFRAVSPDGRTIAYTGYDDQVQTYQVTKLYVMNANGLNCTP